MPSELAKRLNQGVIDIELNRFIHEGTGKEKDNSRSRGAEQKAQGNDPEEMEAFNDLHFGLSIQDSFQRATLVPSGTGPIMV